MKVGDFGMARATEEGIYKTKTAMLPIRWTAPECFKYGAYDSHCDVWSFGILLWELFSYGSVPYAGMSNEQVEAAIMTSYRMPCPDNCPEEIYALMLECWNEAPKLRPNFFTIYQKIQLTWEKYPS
jgi:serine/threonine protein kinase